MKNKLDIDEDVLEAAKELARHQDLPAGQPEAPTVAGFHPFTGGKAVVTNDAVNHLREVEGP